MTSLALRDLPLVYVEDLEAPQLRDEDYKHLTKSRRLSDGAAIAVSDGAGNWRTCELALTPAQLGETKAELRERETAVYFPVIKNERPEYIVQKLTELGVAHIGIISCDRSVVRWPENKVSQKLEKLIEIARQAGMQSKQVFLPKITGVHEAASLGEVAFADPGGALISSLESPARLAIGPEGGFTEDELAARQLLQLPGGILRAETAAVVAGTLLQT